MATAFLTSDSGVTPGIHSNSATASIPAASTAATLRRTASPIGSRDSPPSHWPNPPDPPARPPHNTHRQRSPNRDGLGRSALGLGGKGGWGRGQPRGGNCSVTCIICTGKWHASNAVSLSLPLPSLPSLFPPLSPFSPPSLSPFSLAFPLPLLSLPSLSHARSLYALYDALKVSFVVVGEA